MSGLSEGFSTHVISPHLFGPTSIGLSKYGLSWFSGKCELFGKKSLF